MQIEELSKEACCKALSLARFARLACVRDGQPYIVPIYFVMEGSCLYAFSSTGQKIEWMRRNADVCVQVDSVTRVDDWISVVAFGRYEELLDSPEERGELEHGWRLLQGRAMWWEPAAARVATRGSCSEVHGVFFRIRIAQLTGRRASPGPARMQPAPMLEGARGSSG